MRRWLTCLLCFSLYDPASPEAQTLYLQGDPFEIAQGGEDPKVLIQPDQSYLVLFRRGGSTYGRTFSQDGEALSEEFPFQGTGSNPAATRTQDGFILAWGGIVAQRFQSNGVPAGDQFQVNTSTTATIHGPSIASLPDDGFVIAWTNGTDLDNFNDIFGQRFASNGSRVGQEFQINTYTSGFQWETQIVSDSAGRFVVSFTSKQGDGEYKTIGRRFGSNGAAIGDEFQISNPFGPSQLLARSDGNAEGEFVVTWEYGDQLGFDVLARRFDSSGQPLGAVFDVSTPSSLNQTAASVWMGEDADFFVVWRDPNQILGRRFNSQGEALETPFPISTMPSVGSLDRSQVSIDGDGNGHWLTVWRSGDGQDNSVVYGRRFSLTPPPTPDLTSSPTPTRTGTITPTPTITQTPTMTPVVEQVSFSQPNTPPGQSVTASGVLPSGTYSLCVVPNGVYPIRTIYTGTTVHCVEVDVQENTFPATLVWPSAVEGDYDLLALQTDQDGARIMAGDSLTAAAGLQVGVLLSGSTVGQLGLLTLLGLSLLISARRHCRQAAGPLVEQGSA